MPAFPLNNKLMTGDRPPEYMSGPRLPSEGQICFCLMQNPQDTEKLNSDTLLFHSDGMELNRTDGAALTFL